MWSWSSIPEEGVPKHKRIGEGLHPYPWGDNKEDCPWVENRVALDKELENIYQKYIPLILRKLYMLNNSQGDFNFPLTNDYTLEQLCPDGSSGLIFSILFSHLFYKFPF